MNPVLFLGLVTLDHIQYVVRHPGPNEKIRSQERLLLAGGPAANAAVACSGLGTESLLLTGLGNHPLSDLVRADLEHHGVAILDCCRDQSQPPVISSILVDAASGERSVVSGGTWSESLAIPHRFLVHMESARALLVDGFYPQAAVQVAERFRSKGLPVVLDGGSWKEGLLQLLPLVSHVICSADFFPPGCNSATEVFAFLSRQGIDHIAISRGGSPILYRDGEKSGEVPVPEVVAVDTLGAGDILHGAFCHALASHDFPQALALGAEAASRSCRFRGTRGWLAANVP